MSTRLDRMRALFGGDYLTTETLYQERQAFGLVALVKSAWRELTPFGAENDALKLFTADTPISMQVASTSTNDVDTSGTGAHQVRSIYLTSGFAEAAATSLLNGQARVTVFASVLGLISSRVIDVGSGGVQDGSLYYGDDADSWSGGVPSTPYGLIPTALHPSPITGADPVGATSGLVVAVPTDRVAALGQLTISSEGPALVQVVAHRPTGQFTLWSGPVGAGETVRRFGAPQWLDTDGVPTAIPAETWIVVSAISLGSDGQMISGRLDWILLDVS